MPQPSRSIARLLLSLTMAVGLSAQTLKVGFTDWPPYQWTDDGKPKGLFIELLSEIQRRSGIHFDPVMLPQIRELEAFRRGEIDIENFVNPAWRLDESSNSVYSSSIMKSGDVVLMRQAQSIKARSVVDFSGKRIGCILGYYYPDGFSDAFEAGRMVRDNAKKPEAVVMMLQARRVDAVIMDRIVAHHTIRKLGLEPAEFAITFVFPTKTEFCLRIHKKRKALLPKINAAISSMIADGFVSQTTQKYLP